MRVISFGTFDLLHPGHISILERAKARGDFLIVGVSSDELNFKKKAQTAFYDQETRMAMVLALKCVDEVFVEESLEKKQEYIREKSADVLVMGDDWLGRFNHLKDCAVVYLPRTKDISTTIIKRHFSC